MGGWPSLKQWGFFAVPTKSGGILQVPVAFTQSKSVKRSLAFRALVPLTFERVYEFKI